MTKPTPASIDSLPSEMLLKIIEEVPFDQSTFEAIMHTNPRLQQLMTEYSRSIAGHIACSQYPYLSRMYPPPSEAQAMLNIRLEWLAMLEHRATTVKGILDLIAPGPLDKLISVENHASWMRSLEAGLHLFYRLHDHKTQDGKVAYIDSLPLLSLALMFVTLIFALRTAQGLGTCVMHPDHGPATEEERMELCLCFEECTLQHGPGFLYQILLPPYRTHCHHCDVKDDAYAILMKEYEGIEARQFPGPNGEQPQATLISCVKKAISRRGGCSLQNVYGTAWRVVQDKEVLERGSSILELAFA
ncbi:hypothetical protein MMC30_000934 [Trapelia coarctata]|nr:hypothetical protein [Trapelia coarctata]